MLAAVHLHPAVTGPLALAVVGLLAWYWRRLARPDVPATRRRIRRTSIIIMVPTLVALSLGLSAFDGLVQREAYLLSWSAALLLTMVLICTALLDALNNLRLHTQAKQCIVIAAAADVVREAANTPGEPASNADAQGTSSQSAGDVHP